MVTLTRAKLHLRLAITDEEATAYTDEDAIIQGLINAAYQYAEHYTQATLVTRIKTLTLDGFPAGSHAIELPWSPVTAIESLEYIDPEGIEQSLDAETLRLDTRPIYPLLAPQWGSQWPRTTDEPESITITATAAPQKHRQMYRLLSCCSSGTGTKTAKAFPPSVTKRCQWASICCWRLIESTPWGEQCRSEKSGNRSP